MPPVSDNRIEMIGSPAVDGRSVDPGFEGASAIRNQARFTGPILTLNREVQAGCKVVTVIAEANRGFLHGLPTCCFPAQWSTGLTGTNAR